MNEELKKDVEAAVASIFSQKEEAEQRAETEKALKTSAETISQLTEALEGKNADGEETAKHVTDLEAKVEELTSELEAAKKEATETAEKLTESENKINEMQKDKAAELRMTELADAGVALSDNEAQTAKVRDMDDEAFASYKEELVSLRSAVEAELAKETPTEEEASEETQEEESAADETEVKKEGEEEEVASDENEEEAASDENEEEASDEETAPANVDPGKAMAAALNLEVQPTDGMLAKYAKLGAAMGERMNKE